MDKLILYFRNMSNLVYYAYKNTLLAFMLIICSCEEPSHTTEIVEVQVPMSTDKRFALWGSASWVNPYTNVSEVTYQIIVSYVGADTLTGKIVTARGWLWNATRNEIVDSTAYTYSDTTVWIPYTNKVAEFFSDGSFVTIDQYEFWGASVEVSQ